MATVAHALTSLAKVKAQLQIPTGTTTHDAFIEQVISFVTDWIEQATGGRRFKRTTYAADVYDCNGSNQVFFKQYPVSSVTSVEYNAGTWDTPNWVAFPANSYVPYLSAGYLQFASPLPIAAQYIRITYAAGYLIDFANELDTTKHTLPFDLCGLATNLVAKAVGKRGSDGASQESTEGQSITWSDTLTNEQVAVLAKYGEQSFG